MERAFQIENLVKIFPEFRLGPLNLNLDPGTVLGYVGPNGSGKSTTMHCLVGLLKPDGGTMEIFGKRNNPEKPDWKFDIGYVGDRHVFYESWSGEKNLKFLSQFYPNWSNKFAEELARRFEVPLNKMVKDLSSGNRVKLSLIGALAHSPKLLILDEPTSGLDPVVRTEFLDVLFSVVETGERAIFYSTHIRSDISRLADELAFLDNGQLKIKETKEDLTEKWRRISFKLNNENVLFEDSAEAVCEGNQYRIVSMNHENTVNQLRQLGAEDVIEHRMNIDEIAVLLIKKLK